MGLPTPHLKKEVRVPMTTQHQSPCCPSSVQPRCQMPPISKAHVSSKLQEMLQGKGGCPLKIEAQLHPALMAWVWGSHSPTCSFSTHVKCKQLWVPSGFIFSLKQHGVVKNYTVLAGVKEQGEKRSYLLALLGDILQNLKKAIYNFAVV